MRIDEFNVPTSNWVIFVFASYITLSPVVARFHAAVQAFAHVVSSADGLWFEVIRRSVDQDRPFGRVPRT